MFEEMTSGQYSPGAKCASFETNSDKLYAWVHTLQYRSYEDLTASDDYLINSLDQAKGQIMIVVSNQSSTDTQKLVTITVCLSSLTTNFFNLENFNKELASLEKWGGKLVKRNK